MTLFVLSFKNVNKVSRVLRPQHICHYYLNFIEISLVSCKNYSMLIGQNYIYCIVRAFLSFLFSQIHLLSGSLPQFVGFSQEKSGTIHRPF